MTKAKSALLYSQRFFAHLLDTKLKLVFDEHCATAKTDGRTVWVGPWFTDSLTIQQQIFVLAHETMHAVMLHMDRAKHYDDNNYGPEGTAWDAFVWNQACDYNINDLLKTSNVGQFVDEGLHDPKYPHTMSADEIYVKLIQDQQQQKPSQPGSGEGEGGERQSQPGQGQPGQGQQQGNAGHDEHVMPSEAFSEAEKKDMEREVKSAARAAEGVGQLPGGMREFVDKLYNPGVDWRAVIRTEFDAVAAVREADWNHPNKKTLVWSEVSGMPMPVMPTPRGQGAGCVLVQVDTSGSIGDREISTFLGGIKSLVEEVTPDELWILWTDSAVAKAESFDSDIANELERVITRVREDGAPGGGGTDMGAAWGYCDKWGLMPDVMVTFTDGLTPWPESSPWPHVTVLAGGERECPFGVSVVAKL
jgi:predicted metal-dependent peptidase